MKVSEMYSISTKYQYIMYNLLNWMYAFWSGNDIAHSLSRNHLPCGAVNVTKKMLPKIREQHGLLFLPL